MAAPLLNSVLGHKAKYDTLRSKLPADKVGAEYVGGSDPLLTGFIELEIIRRVADIQRADLIDIGCGIGRLTKHLLYENVRSYLGTDVVPQILQEAINAAAGRDNFRFALVNGCTIPAEDASADIVTAFSVITHLIDEEIFEYMCEARRVLRATGIAIFSFGDFMNPAHQSTFFKHARQFRHGHGDLLRFSTREVLNALAKEAGFSGSSEVMEGTELFPISGSLSRLLDISAISQKYAPGQSQFILRP